MWNIDDAVEVERGHIRGDNLEREDLSFAKREVNGEMKEDKVDDGKPKTLPPASVMTRLILIMVWRKLIRNPNTYSSLIGLIWSLVSFRYFSCLFTLLHLISIFQLSVVYTHLGVLFIY